jgi:hypothetical protein
MSHSQLRVAAACPALKELMYAKAKSTPKREQQAGVVPEAAVRAHRATSYIIGTAVLSCASPVRFLRKEVGAATDSNFRRLSPIRGRLDLDGNR